MLPLRVCLHVFSMMHYTSWTVFSAFCPRCTWHMMPFAMISQELYFCVTKMMRLMYAVFSKLKVLTVNMPNKPNHIFSIAEFGDSFQLQKLLFHDYSCYLMATRISSARVNGINLKSSLGRYSSQRLPVIWQHNLSTLRNLVSCQIQLVSHCTIKWALIRMA